MRKGSPLTLRNHFIQPYRALDSLPRILLTLVIYGINITCFLMLTYHHLGWIQYHQQFEWQRHQFHYP